MILRVIEVAEGAIFEVRTGEECRRYRLLNQRHIKMTEEFVRQLAWIETIRPQLPSPQIAEALKPRALEEFIAGMDRSSKPAATFAAAWLGQRWNIDFDAASFAYRPGIGRDDALRRLAELRNTGFVWVLDADNALLLRLHFTPPPVLPSG